MSSVRNAPDLIAFYGSLLDARVRRQVGVADFVERLRTCTIPGRLYDRGPFPGLVPGQGRVTGALFALTDPRAIPLLDAYEECDAEPPLFLRAAVPLIDPSTRAWVYYFNRPVGPYRRIHSGRWTRHGLP